MHACVVTDVFFVYHPDFSKVFIFNLDRHTYEIKTDHALLINVTP